MCYAAKLTLNGVADTKYPPAPESRGVKVFSTSIF